MSNGVKAWSYSAYETYAQCPAKYKYAKIDKLKEPKSVHLERGIRVHEDMESFLRGTEPAVPESGEKFAPLLEGLRDFDPFVEQEWAFTSNWKRTDWRDWNNCWVRIKVDACVVYEDGGEGEIIDFKTGKTKANDKQLELYALAGMLLYPRVTDWRLRFWYLDSGDEVVLHRHKSTKDRIRHAWEERVKPMFNDTVFAPTPNKFCGWCHFRKSNGGPCSHG